MSDQTPTTGSGGTREPHCLYTRTGVCAIENTVAWGETLSELADQAWEANVDSNDPTEAIKTGEESAKIKATADEAWQEACELNPCINCPRRREFEG